VDRDGRHKSDASRIIRCSEGRIGLHEPKRKATEAVDDGSKPVFKSLNRRKTIAYFHAKQKRNWRPEGRVPGVKKKRRRRNSGINTKRAVSTPQTATREKKKRKAVVKTDWVEHTSFQNR